MGWLRRAVESSPYDAVPAQAGAPRSRALQLFDRLAAGRFAALPEGLTAAELRALDAVLLPRLELEREERRMHFGALALVSLLFFLLLPQLLAGGFQGLALNALALLLLCLVVPYVFVYFAWENRVRAMGLARLRLLEELRLREQDAPAATPDAHQTDAPVRFQA